MLRQLKNIKKLPVMKGLYDFSQVLKRVRQREADLKACHAEIERLEKANACKTNFIATLGHELRNPLAAISGGIQIMQLSPEKKDWALDLMQHNLWAIMAQLDDLMDITRIEQDKMKLNTEIISLKDQIRKTVDSITGYVEPKQQVFNLVLPTEDIYINADPARFNQVISNLVINASKYTPVYGALSLTLSEKDGQAVIEVEDNGIGIPENMREAVFEPFRQIDNSTNAPGGVGIGLALVKKITKLLGGQICVENGTNDIGTRFTLTFPVSTEGQQIKPESKNQSCLLPSGYRVLIIDDNRDSASMLQSMLEKAGAHVEIATDAAFGLTTAKLFLPQCMIVDIGLPDMDGHDLVGLLKAQCGQDALCIALTGYGYEGAYDKAKKAGFDHYMIKPASFEHLLSLMTEMPHPQKKPAKTG